MKRPLVMGIVNLTPDSFSGDGYGNDPARAIAHARHQFEAGADILDLGAESSRPGAASITVEEELSRLRPVLDTLGDWGIPLCVDTRKPEVMRYAIDAGASMINDIHALQAPGAMEVVADSNVTVCLMHMQNEPATMQSEPHYENVVTDVIEFLKTRVAACLAAGIAPERLMLDPGFGFGKTLAHNLALLRHLDRIVALGFPVLVGLSRKSMLGTLTGQKVDDRLSASVAAALIAVQRGAAIVRVHDVAATGDALAIFNAVRNDV